CKATHCVNGRAALELLQQDPTRFDMVLLDVVMPVMDGMELLDVMQACTT
ncbi:unnamed protein product, partial [Discosporangium mesarthrocarpum]